jgi:hypothetical protein
MGVLILICKQTRALNIEAVQHTSSVLYIGCCLQGCSCYKSDGGWWWSREHGAALTSCFCLSAVGPFFSKSQSVIQLGRLDLGLEFRLTTDLACLHFLPKMLWREVGRSAWFIESQKDPSDCWVSSIHSEKPPTRFIVCLEECFLRVRTHGHHRISFVN